MKLEVSIEKKHLTILILILILFSIVLVLGYGTNNPPQFGHTYTEINFQNSVSTNDVRDNSLSARDLEKTQEGYAKLNVLLSKEAERAPSKCEYSIYSCNGNTIDPNSNSFCKQGYRVMTGTIGFSGIGTDWRYQGSSEGYCDGNVVMMLCCQN